MQNIKNFKSQGNCFALQPNFVLLKIDNKSYEKFTPLKNKSFLKAGKSWIMT